MSHKLLTEEHLTAAARVAVIARTVVALARCGGPDDHEQLQRAAERLAKAVDEQHAAAERLRTALRG